MISQEERLKVFQSQNNIVTKGPLSVVIQFTRLVRNKTFPLDPNDYKTSQEGQVAGLGGGRVEVWDIQQFLSANVYEHSLFDEAKRNATLSDIISRYNNIVQKTESDPSLRIEFEAR